MDRERARVLINKTIHGKLDTKDRREYDKLVNNHTRAMREIKREILGLSKDDFVEVYRLKLGV